MSITGKVLSMAFAITVVLAALRLTGLIGLNWLAVLSPMLIGLGAIAVFWIGLWIFVALVEKRS